MRVSGYIRTVLLIACAVLSFSSCQSVLEDRGECPCYLDVTLLRQSGDIFTEDKAWCSTWEEDRRLAEDVYSPVVAKDGTKSYVVTRKADIPVVITNMIQEGNRIVASVGSQMVRLYVSRKDVDCSGDLASVTFDSFCKQFVSVHICLNKEALPFRERLKLTFDGPYDGVSLPSLECHMGTFSCMSDFDEEGKAVLCIPPQGGPGLKVGIRLDNNPPAIMDLYRTMLDAGFDWKGISLDDFEIELGLNSVSSVIEITDWHVVELENKTY